MNRSSDNLRTTTIVTRYAPPHEKKGEPMALIECPECAGALSSTAVSCPHCGYRSASTEPPKSRNPLRGWRAVAVGVAYVLAAVGLMYALPEYAVLLAAAALVCLFVELRSGLVRRAIRIG